MKAWFGGGAIVVALAILAARTQGPEQGVADTVKAVDGAAIASPRPPRMVDYRLVDARLKRLIADPRMVGLAIGIVEDGQITYLRGYGETLRGSGDPVTADTVFRWASVSKGVASTLVAGLAAEGRLALSDPIPRYAPSLRLTGGGERTATVTDLLSHRLGLHGNAEDPALEDGGDPRFLRAKLATLPPICPVGTCHAYQNVAYDASSELVEKVTAKPYADAAAQRLFAPLGMKSASASLEGLLASPSWARPHDGSGRPQARGLSPAYYRVPAAGGVNSSVRDLARWMQAQMGETPRTLPPEVLRTLHTPRVRTPGENFRQRKYRERIGNAHYGLGWRSYDYAGRRVVGHHGGISGYRASIMFDPDRHSGVVALWNSGSGQPWGFEYEVLDMIYGLDRRDWMGLDTPKGHEPGAMLAAQPADLAAAATARAATVPAGSIATRAQMGR